MSNQLQNYADTWSELHAEVDHLESLISSDLNSKQLDYISEYINYLSDKIEDMEFYLLELDEHGECYHAVRDIADTLTVTPSKEFLSHLNNQLSEMETVKVNIDTRTIEDVKDILSIRSYHCLLRAGFKTVQQVKEATLQDMLNVRNLGRLSLEEIQNVFNIKFV